MRLLLAVIATALLGYILWYGIHIHSEVRACTLKYQDDLTTARYQAGSVKGDMGNFCSTSYTIISSWEDCVNAVAGKLRSPQAITTRIQPLVLTILKITGEPSLNLTAVKNEHDTQCQNNINLMFYPPAPPYSQ